MIYSRGHIHTLTHIHSYIIKIFVQTLLITMLSKPR